MQLPNHGKSCGFMNFKLANNNMHKGSRIILLINYQGKCVHATFGYPKIKTGIYNCYLNKMQQHIKFHDFCDYCKKHFFHQSKGRRKYNM
jgi:hypothetical protein